MIEIVQRDRGRADVRLLTLTGHPRLGWERWDEDYFPLSAVQYRRLAARVDAALARYREPDRDEEGRVTIVCMDGPGFLTERVRAGRVTSLVGQCPPAMDEEHPNHDIAVLVDALICGHRGRAVRDALFTRERCALIRRR